MFLNDCRHDKDTFGFGDLCLIFQGQGGAKRPYLNQIELVCKIYGGEGVPALSESNTS